MFARYIDAIVSWLVNKIYLINFFDFVGGCVFQPALVGCLSVTCCVFWSALGCCSSHTLISYHDSYMYLPYLSSVSHVKIANPNYAKLKDKYFEKIPAFNSFLICIFLISFAWNSINGWKQRKYLQFFLKTGISIKFIFLFGFKSDTLFSLWRGISKSKLATRLDLKKIDFCWIFALKHECQMI